VPQQTTTANAPLIIWPQSVALAGSPSGGLHLVGTLYPSYAGPNNLYLRLMRKGRAVLPGHSLRLTVTMPGMAIRPIRFDLLPAGRQRSARVVRPMFGAYRADVVLQTRRGRAIGNLLLALNLQPMSCCRDLRRGRAFDPGLIDAHALRAASPGWFLLGAADGRVDQGADGQQLLAARGAQVLPHLGREQATHAGARLPRA
jgi:hypothetical protein